MNPPIIVIHDPKESYLTIKFVGDLTTDRLEDLKTELQVATASILATFNETQKKIHILLDMSEFSGNYSLDALTSIVEFAKGNVPYVEKTACFGGSDKVNMAGEIAIVLSHRDNIKICHTKEEALQWLG